MNNGLKKTIGKIHLWLGLTCGSVVFISLLAASIFVWEEELTNWYHQEKVLVPQVKDATLSFNTLYEAVQKAVPGEKINRFKIECIPEKAYVFYTYENSKSSGWTWASGYSYRSNVYVDQYSGKVLGVVDVRYDWISCMRMLHQCLLLNYDVGHYIVGFSTLIIIILIVTGLILWFPKNRAALKQRIWFRWKNTTRWKRKNYDIHNIGGFYVFALILLLAITGLAWTFDWWTNGIYRILGNDPEKVFSDVPDIKTSGIEKDPSSFDYVITKAKSFDKNWRTINLSIPKKDHTAQKISVFLRFHSGQSGWEESHQLVFNSFTGLLHHVTPHEKKTLGAKWRNSNYAIHVGSIYGLPTKILACFASLFCASLPVTGFYIWWGRQRKKRSSKT